MPSHEFTRMIDHIQEVRWSEMMQFAKAVKQRLGSPVDLTIVVVADAIVKTAEAFAAEGEPKP